MTYTELAIISSRYERILQEGLDTGYKEATMRRNMEDLIRTEEAKGSESTPAAKALVVVKKNLKLALEKLSRKPTFKKESPFFIHLADKVDKANWSGDIRLVLSLAINLIVPPDPDESDEFGEFDADD